MKIIKIHNYNTVTNSDTNLVNI